MNITTKTETSKYPSSASITSMVDEDNKSSLSILGLKKNGTSNMFVHVSVTLSSTSAKQEAITLAYKILGLE
jgi:hypothetical protein